MENQNLEKNKAIIVRFDKECVEKINDNLLDELVSDFVVSQKTLTAIHSGNFLGIPATGKRIEMELIEIIRLENGQYIEHWAESNLSKVLASLK